jgi:hypothetical protein
VENREQEQGQLLRRCYWICRAQGIEEHLLREEEQLMGWALRDRERVDREVGLEWERMAWGLLQTREGVLPWGLLQRKEEVKVWGLRMKGEVPPWVLPLVMAWEQKSRQHQGHQWI